MESFESLLLNNRAVQKIKKNFIKSNLEYNIDNNGYVNFEVEIGLKRRKNFDKAKSKRFYSKVLFIAGRELLNRYRVIEKNKIFEYDDYFVVADFYVEDRLTNEVGVICYGVGDLLHKKNYVFVEGLRKINRDSEFKLVGKVDDTDYNFVSLLLSFTLLGDTNVSFLKYCCIGINKFEVYDIDSTLISDFNKLSID